MDIGVVYYEEKGGFSMPIPKEVDGGIIFIPTEDELLDIEIAKKELREKEEREKSLDALFDRVAKLEEQVTKLTKLVEGGEE